jgi:hypothetical protein
MGQWQELLDRSNKAGIQFIQMELDAAESILSRFDSSSDLHKRKRVHEEANKAYLTALKCLPHLSLTDEQDAEISVRFRNVNARLNDLAEVLLAAREATP